MFTEQGIYESGGERCGNHDKEKWKNARLRMTRCKTVRRVSSGISVRNLCCLDSDSCVASLRVHFTWRVYFTAPIWRVPCRGNARNIAEIYRQILRLKFWLCPTFAVFFPATCELCSFTVSECQVRRAFIWITKHKQSKEVVGLWACSDLSGHTSLSAFSNGVLLECEPLSHTVINPKIQNLLKYALLQKWYYF